eukprot:1153972-Pelagomonas_calceolata.AAC.1
MSNIPIGLQPGMIILLLPPHSVLNSKISFRGGLPPKLLPCTSEISEICVSLCCLAADTHWCGAIDSKRKHSRQRHAPPAAPRCKCPLRCLCRLPKNAAAESSVTNHSLQRLSGWSQGAAAHANAGQECSSRKLCNKSQS